jgi:hypothetical protein
VARALEIALEVQRPIGKGALGFALGRSERLFELPCRANDAHAAPATSGSGLDEQREADLLGAPVGEHRNSGVARYSLRGDLVAAEAECFSGRPDPGEPRCLDRFREVGVLGEEPVAGMDRVGARLASCPNVLLGAEVARDLHGRVRRARVE